jgi:hypothetical protein
MASEEASHHRVDAAMERPNAVIDRADIDGYGLTGIDVLVEFDLVHRERVVGTVRILDRQRVRTRWKLEAVGLEGEVCDRDLRGLDG